MRKRTATIRSGNAEAIARYLPSNYEVVSSTETETLIEGHDDSGWTLDGFVLPRLASGLYFGSETSSTEVVLCPNCRTAFMGEVTPHPCVD